MTLVYQLDQGVKRLLFIGKNRTAATFKDFFDLLGEERSKALEFIASDMWFASAPPRPFTSSIDSTWRNCSAEPSTRSAVRKFEVSASKAKIPSSPRPDGCFSSAPIG